MPRLKKVFKKYERHLLLGMVIILLATFSITGAIKCAQSQPSKGVDVGGSFRVTPTERISFSSEEIAAVRARYHERGGRAFVAGPTVRYRQLLRNAGRPGPWIATWLHVIVTETAKRAGYRVGEAQRDQALKEVVSTAMGGVDFTDVNYDRFLRQEYRGNSADLRQTVSDVVLSDQFLEPFVESARYELGYDEAYGEWKAERERVNLLYVALSGEAFAEAVRTEEQTRSQIGRQEDLLSKAARVARQVRVLVGSAEAYEKRTQKPAETLADLQAAGTGAAGAQKDEWGHEIAYSRKDGKPWPRSAGPDGAMDTADDVTPDVVRAFETHALLREVANALRQWREAAGSWPDSLAKLKERPAEGSLPPLKRPDVKDAYGNDLVYEPAAEGAAGPKLSSAGADGKPGTEDDVVAEVSADTLRVPIGAGLAAYLLPDLKDAWDRPLRVQVRAPEGWMVEVASAGPDGAWGTPDDVLEGNLDERRDFYGNPTVKTDFVDPIRRRFRAVVMHLPLLPDDVLKSMWNDEALKAHRPTDEEKLFEQWRWYKDQPFYGSADPRDPETGYGAELAKRLAPDAKAWLVPDRAIFGEPPESFTKSDDPLRKEYLDKGWREVVFREHFVANVLAGLLDAARKSREAAKAWQKKKDGGQDVGEKPAETTPKELFEKTLRPHLPGDDVPYAKYYETPKLLSQSEWEALPDFDDPNFSTNMSSATGEGDYPKIVIPLHQRMTHALSQNLEFKGQRQREFAEVQDDPAFQERYLASKRLDRAQKELEGLRRLAETKEAEAAGTGAKPEDGKPGDAKPEDAKPGDAKPGDAKPGDAKPDPAALAAARAKAFDAALAEWSAKNGATAEVAETGWFIGSSPPAPAKPPETASPEERLRILRRNYARLTGYETVRAEASKQDTVEATAGTFGRKVLRDETTGPDATSSAYLIRVVEQRDPPKEEMSPARWAQIAYEKYYGDLLQQGGPRNPNLHMRAGAVSQVLGHFLEDLSWVQARCGLETKTDLSQAATLPAR